MKCRARNLSRSRRTVVGVLLIAIIVTAQVLNGAPAAEARCAGVNNGTTSTLGAEFVIVAEKPVSGSCDNNHTYTAQVRRVRPDVAEYVQVWTQDNGVWTRRQFTSSTTGAQFSYYAADSHSFMTLCWNEPGPPPAGPAHCGWGSNYAAVGLTPGNSPATFTNNSLLHGVNSGF
jgi:hypothetical protein